MTAESKIGGDGGLLEITWADGHRAAFHALWLRDNCPCLRCRHGNGQKLTNITALSAETQIDRATADGDGVAVVFSPDEHSARFDFSWLRNFAAVAASPPQVLWDGESLSAADISRDYAETKKGGAALADWLGGVARFGCAILRDAPREKETVCKIAEWFGHVRETNYGRLFDVVAVADPNNLAYTGMALSVHTDNPYRDPPPGLQLLHCLHNSADGGDSILADGFMAAKILREEDENHWRELSARTVPFRFCDAVADLRNRLPILDVAADGELRAVNFNNRSVAAFDMPPAEVLSYYAAYRHFAEILNRPPLGLQFKMDDGDLFIVDNRRVLHGRAGFAGGGERHLQGCYADRDALLSKWTMLGGRATAVQH